MSDARTFWVIKCPDCGKWQVCRVDEVLKYTFKCRSCRRSAKLYNTRVRGGISLKHHKVVGESKAGKLVAQLNERDNQDAGFYTYTGGRR